jgi:hypothetical protein
MSGIHKILFCKTTIQRTGSLYIFHEINYKREKMACLHYANACLELVIYKLN